MGVLLWRWWGEKMLFVRGWGHRDIALEVMGTLGCYSGGDRDVEVLPQRCWVHVDTLFWRFWGHRDIAPDMMGTKSCCSRGNRDTAMLLWRW